MNKGYSIVPEGYKDKDPRSLLYHYPSITKVAYAKIMARFCFYYALDVAEKMAWMQGFLLVPFGCVHWNRRKQLSEKDRKIKVGRRSFYMIEMPEMTVGEKRKLNTYIENLHMDDAEDGDLIQVSEEDERPMQFVK